MSKFERIKGDYQITTEVENIDLLRILRENVRDGIKNYVIVVTPTVCVLFMTKKFSKRVEALDVFDFSEIVLEHKYGFHDEFGKSYVTGEQVRSTGFTAGTSFPIELYDEYLATLKSVPELEAKIEKEFAERRKRMGTIKIVAGE